MVNEVRCCDSDRDLSEGIRSAPAHIMLMLSSAARKVAGIPNGIPSLLAHLLRILVGAPSQCWDAT